MKSPKKVLSGILLIVATLILTTQSTVAALQYIPPELIEEQHHLEEHVRKNPKSAEARFELAMNYAYTGWVEIAWAQLKKIPDYDDNYSPKVIKKYKALIKKEPKEWKHHFKLAFGYYFAERKEDSLVEFKKVVEINPDQVWAMGFVALLLGEEEKYDESIIWCRRALRKERKATAIHFLLATAYQRKGNFFGFLGESIQVMKLKSAEAKYAPVPPE